MGSKAVGSLKVRVKDELERYLEQESFLPNELATSPMPVPIPVGRLEDIEQAAVKLRIDWGFRAEGPVAYIVAFLKSLASRS